MTRNPATSGKNSRNLFRAPRSTRAFFFRSRYDRIKEARRLRVSFSNYDGNANLFPRSAYGIKYRDSVTDKIVQKELFVVNYRMNYQMQNDKPARDLRQLAMYAMRLNWEIGMLLIIALFHAKSKNNSCREFVCYYS